MTDLTVKPLDHLPKGRVELPGSSLGGTVAMVAAILADGRSTLRRVRIDHTAQTVIKLLDRLGAIIDVEGRPARVRMRGWAGHLPQQEGEYGCGADRLAWHLALGLCSLGYGEYRFAPEWPGHATETAQGQDESPVDIGPTVNAFRDLGVQIGYEDQDGRLPLGLRARGLSGGRTLVRGAVPETLTALLVVAPYAAQDVFIETDRPMGPGAVFVPEVVEAFGVAVIEDEQRRFIVAAPQRYRGREYVVPPDPLEAALAGIVAAVKGGTTEIDTGSSPPSKVLQEILARLEAFGAVTAVRENSIQVAAPSDSARLHGAEIDLTGMNDFLAPIALTALSASGPTRLSGLEPGAPATNLMTELTKLGASLELNEDVLTLSPPETIRWKDLDAHGDASLAIALAAASLNADRAITINRVPPRAATAWVGLIEALAMR
ncbi:MAG: hypothetical protein JXQ73_12145 [Phycisphaerae bacterium]|nr:hypothetical protein [Phycisphaerae bacterium]